MKNDRNAKQQVKTIGTGGNVNYSRLKGVFRKIGCMRLSFDVPMAMLGPSSFANGCNSKNGSLI